ncbi:histone-like nucleoid-structuring protein Lsr2 [Microbacterium testaceum]|uniref:Lsr2 family protein n=1 Tax=Microbacterium testaceum TaxID=2033 RepID=A0A2T7VN18_MICTE|nr:histone-like nucleoid-structuring protein Lsr2 [Microbacterium testaceum]PVE58790.1 hypothetical protein DC432_15650 [Microbacterium testaceum]
MKDTITVVKDSLTKKEVSEYSEHYVSIDGIGYSLQLSPDSLRKLTTALEPFVNGEDTSVEPSRYYSPMRRARAAKGEGEGANSLPPEYRAAVAAFVEEKGLGKVAKGGSVRKAFIDAFEAAGRPGLTA